MVKGELSVGQFAIKLNQRVKKNLDPKREKHNNLDPSISLTQQLWPTTR